jgi:hypothetical protein
VSPADKYRRNAADCFAVAQHLSDADLKATMLSMARSWEALAGHAERSADLELNHGTPPAADDHIQ